MALTQVDQGMLGANAQYTGFKNRIINGAMVIDQRNGYAAITLATGGNYAADRFVLNKGTAAATVAAQVQSASLANFEKCLVWNTSSGSAPASGDVNGIWQAIEGFNVSDLQLGTANAQTFTVSFWLKCSSTGQIGVALENGAVNRSYVTTITVASANTWAQYSITVAGDTSGTWAKDNTTGLYVVLDMGSGTTAETSTTNAWQSGNYKRTSACLKPVATTGTIVYLTGIQLEKGSTATSFDYRPYGTELSLCQRYYYKATARPLSTTATAQFTYYAGANWPVTMRVSPTVGNGSFVAGAGSAGTFASFLTSVDGTGIYNSAGNWTIGAGITTTFDASAEL